MCMRPRPAPRTQRTATPADHKEVLRFHNREAIDDIESVIARIARRQAGWLAGHGALSPGGGKGERQQALSSEGIGGVAGKPGEHRFNSTKRLSGHFPDEPIFRGCSATVGRPQGGFTACARCKGGLILLCSPCTLTHHQERR